MQFLKSIFSVSVRKTYLKAYQRRKYSTNLVKTVKFKTCGQVFEELRKQYPKLYKNSPKDGLPVEVEYVDTITDPNKQTKTIVALHGVPGNHQHFSALIDHFSDCESNVRVIVPNFPTFALTRQTFSFWHSSAEKTQFLRDFFAAINVKQIDCLISHSAGIQPNSLLWSDPQELSIKSIGIFCPQPFRFRKYLLSIGKMTAKFGESKLGLMIFDALKPHLIAHKLGYPMAYANVDEVLLTSTISVNSQHETLPDRLSELIRKRLSVLVVFGEKDSLIPKKRFYSLVNHLGVNHKNIVYYTVDGELENDVNNANDVIKVIVFRGGGHFAYNKYGNVVNQYVQQLLQ